MKNFLIVLLLAMLSNAAYTEDRCAVHAELAKQIMASRQAGVPVTDVITAAKETKAYTEATRELILKAYEAPRYQTEEHQQREVTEFQNAAYVACARQRG